MKKTALFIFTFLMFMSCSRQNSGSNQQENSDRKFAWLIGTWSNSSPEGSLYEIWNVENDSALAGFNFMLVNNDTVFYERIRIEKSGHDWHYIPVVKNQNDGMPVTFTLISESDGKFIFENKLHDFPQRIVYFHKSTDSLHAWIEGMDKGKFRQEDFFMVREK
jgi:hypothetical protein